MNYYTVVVLPYITSPGPSLHRESTPPPCQTTSGFSSGLSCNIQTEPHPQIIGYMYGQFEARCIPITEHGLEPETA